MLLLNLVLLFLLPSSIAKPEQQWLQGTTTTTWDACVPACAYHINTVFACTRDNKPIKFGDFGGIYYDNACMSPTSPKAAYSCDYFQPMYISDTYAMGFAGNWEESNCGNCYELHWTGGPARGKTMTVMVINAGGVKPGDFDIYVAGGGSGDYSAIDAKYQGVGSYSKGHTFGGTSTAQECVKMPTDRLSRGCSWRYNWANDGRLGHLNEAPVLYKKVTCPPRLQRYAVGDIDQPAHLSSTRMRGSGRHRTHYGRRASEASDLQQE